jgi:hypothetical protein
MLCFEVWKNGEKLTTAGVNDTGVLSFILSWVGKENNASSNAGSSAGNIPGMACSVTGMEGIAHIDWYATDQLNIGDELSVRLISSDFSDPPIRSRTPPRGNPDWIRKRTD